MYRILLVDDEPLILAGIESMVDWEKYGCVVADKATNGQQALEKVRGLQPDIVITDIKMPVMSGIEFMEECRKDSEDTVFLLLTNLEEFALAQKALRLGAVDYLVKIEITPEIMGESLKKAVEICNERQKLKENPISGEALQRNAEEITRSFFTELLSKKGGADQKFREKWEEEAKALELEKMYNGCAVLRIRPYNRDSRLFHRADEEDWKEIQDYAENLLKQFMNRISSVYCVIPWERRGFFVLLPDGEKQKETFPGTGDKIQRIFEDYFGCRVLTALSSPAENIWEGFKEALEQLEDVEEYYYYHSEKSVLLAEDVLRSVKKNRHNRHDVFDISFLKSDLQQALVMQDREMVEKVFGDVAGLFLDYHPAKEQVMNACVNLYYFFFSYVEGDKLKDNEEFPHPARIVERLSECFTLQENVEWLTDLGKWAGRMLESFKGGSKMDKIVDSVKKFVQENYKEKLTLSIISAKIGISQGYLSSVFKKQTGNNLTDYVNQIKIDKAKEFLGLHEYMMYEISDMLGFENPYYFSKVFKKMTGMTPSEYENMRKQ